ncbi:MAG: hypothetical protein LBG96_13215 [Tannerella sp.]|jgi:hypothetical protein|nr:hypothetical protein [Tannerella sp.]
MERLIKLDNQEMRRKIAKTYGVTLPCVSLALNFQRNSEQAVAIRAMALENGGILFEESTNQKLTQKNIK